MPRLGPSADFLTRHRFVALFALLLLFFVAVPIVHQVREALLPAVPGIIESILFIAVLAAVIISISTSRASKLLALALGLPVVFLVVLHAANEWEWVAIVRHLAEVLFLGYAIVVTLRFILTSQQITSNIVFASLCVYLLLGVVWALGYSVIEHFDHNAFHFSAASEQSPPQMTIGTEQFTAALYFSYTTLTTLGFGDIVPVSPIARAFATLEAITGQLYIAVLVARLVGLHISASPTPEQSPGRVVNGTED